MIIGKIIDKAQFDFSGIYKCVSIFTNPFYFVRKNLYKNIKYFSKYFSGKMLDFGCGAKPYKNLFKNVDMYIGCDIEASGHDHSKENIDIYYDGINLPFNDEEYDCIFSSEVFEHIDNIEHILTELNRVIKPGGYMLVTVPFVWNEHEVPYDFRRYTCYGVKSLLNKSGFKVITIKKSTNYLEMLFQMIVEYIRRSIDKKVCNPYVKLILSIFLISPFVIWGGFFSTLLHQDWSFYGDNIVLCKKIS